MTHILLVEDNKKLADYIQTYLKSLGYIVSHEGESIKEEDQQKIFLPFVRLENDENIAKKGFGLGLAIAQMIVK